MFINLYLALLLKALRNILKRLLSYLYDDPEIHNDAVFHVTHHSTPVGLHLRISCRDQLTSLAKSKMPAISCQPRQEASD